MPIGPSCAVADVTPNGRDRARQHAGRLRDARQRSRCSSGCPATGPGPVLGGREHVRQQPGAVTTRARRPRSCRSSPGAPVRLQFMRWDEHGWDNYGPAVLSDMRGGVDAQATSSALDYTAFGDPVALDALRRDDAERRRSRSTPPGARQSADAINSGTPVHDRKPPGDGEVAAALGHLLQDLGAPGAALPADLLRLRAARRRARARGRAGSLRVQAAEHRRPRRSTTASVSGPTC